MTDSSETLIHNKGAKCLSQTICNFKINAGPVIPKVSGREKNNCDNIKERIKLHMKTFENSKIWRKFFLINFKLTRKHESENSKNVRPNESRGPNVKWSKQTLLSFISVWKILKATAKCAFMASKGPFRIEKPAILTPDGKVPDLEHRLYRMILTTSLRAIFWKKKFRKKMNSKFRLLKILSPNFVTKILSFWKRSVNLNEFLQNIVYGDTF